MRRLRWYLFAITASAILLEALLFLVPAPAFITNVQEFKSQLIVVSSFSIFYFAAAVLFLYGMYEFKPEMRRSYLIITSSMAFFGFVNLQYPLLLNTGHIPGPWVTYGGSLLIIIPGVIMHYWGVRHVAKTLGLTNASTSVTVMLATMILLAGVVMFLPHLREIPEFWFAAHQIAAVANFVLNLFSALILVAIVQNVGASYQPAFRWLKASVIVSTLGFAHIIVAALFGQDTAYTRAGTTAAPFIVVSLLYAMAGYYFCKVRLYGQHDTQTIVPGQGMLDAVISTANLISDPREVDNLLDGVRRVTAKLGPNEALTPTDSQQLADIYLQLEDYLLHREKLKTFTKNGLRARLNEEAVQLISFQPENNDTSVSIK